MTVATSFLPGVLGHEDVRTRLESILMAGRVPNGLLFTGDEGRGKRTLAVALARELLIRGAPPGDTQRAARMVDQGTHPALVHVEPLRDERFVPVRRVRRLLQSCSLSIPYGSCRVVVLARLQSLNDESGNALLKFIEEPPGSTVILATARDAGSVIETIRSRLHMMPVGPVETGHVAMILSRGGFSPDDASTLSPLCRGAPGHAWRLSRGDLERNLLAPLRRFFDPSETPFGWAESLVKTAKDEGVAFAESREGVGPAPAVRALKELRAARTAELEDERRGDTTLEAARTWIKPVVESVGTVFSELLRQESSGRGKEAILAPRVLPEGSPLRGAAAPRLQAGLEAVLGCLENLDRNLTVNLALESLALFVRE